MIPLIVLEWRTIKMMQGKKTEWELKQETALDKAKIGWEITVKNTMPELDGLQAEVERVFKSTVSDLDCVAHKLKLDLITAIKHGFTTPFTVEVKRKLQSC